MIRRKKKKLEGTGAGLQGIGTTNGKKHAKRNLFNKDKKKPCEHRWGPRRGQKKGRTKKLTRNL